MPVLINFKICDNVPECNGIQACPTGALYWDDEKKTLAVDESKCILCGACERACEVGAIRVARTQEEYERIKKEIEEDPRTVADLFVDRYGAMPVEPAFRIEHGFDVEVLQSPKPTVVELYNDDSIQCLIKSVPIKHLFQGRNIKYRKTEATPELMQEYGIKQLPCLLFFNQGRLVGKVEGYYPREREQELKRKVDEIMERLE